MRDILPLKMLEPYSAGAGGRKGRKLEAEGFQRFSCEFHPSNAGEATEFLIRLAENDDIASIMQLMQICYTPYIDRMHKTPAPLTYDYRHIIQAGKTWVIEQKTLQQKHEKPLVGLLTVEIVADAVMIENLAIHPNQQGFGLAKRLIYFVEKYAVTQGIRKITLYTNEKMTENIAIYQHLGFWITQKIRESGFNRVYFEKDVIIYGGF